MPLTPEEQERHRRAFAEQIIAGEYDNLVVILAKNGEAPRWFYEGPELVAIGLTEVIKKMIMMPINPT